jgi:aryl-alcohol dehydrogenase-like predicted oxidoreductase
MSRQESSQERLDRIGEAAELSRDVDVEYARARRGAGAGQVYALRIPARNLAALRELAAQRGVEPSALARRWVVQRLDEELGRSSTPRMIPAVAVREALENLLTQYPKAG